jgi:hypothetical protein
MAEVSLPIFVIPSNAARQALGSDLAEVAVLAMRAILRNRRGIEVAHQQIRYRKRDFAFSSRIGARGDLIIELDLGDPKLSDRIVLEHELRRAARRPEQRNGNRRNRRVG